MYIEYKYVSMNASNCNVVSSSIILFLIFFSSAANLQKKTVRLVYDQPVSVIYAIYERYCTNFVYT